MTNIRKILIIDDWERKYQKEALSLFFPQADIRVACDFSGAENLFEKGFIPDILSTDCNNYTRGDKSFGENNSRLTIEWFDNNKPGFPKPVFFFSSADTKLAVQARKAALIHSPDIDAYVIDGSNSEIYLAKELYDGDRKIRCRDAETTGFREFLRDYCGISLPMNEGEIDTFILERKNENIDPEDLADLVDKGKLDRDETISKIGQEAIDTSRIKWHPSADIFDRDDFEEIKDLTSIFELAVGAPVTGHAAFSKADVETLVKEGKKPVLFLKSYTTDFIPDMNKLAGIVLLDPGLSGHMKMLLDAHGVSGALGAKDMHKHFPFIRTPDGKPLGSTKNIHEHGGKSVFTDFENALYDLGNRHIERHFPDGDAGNEDFKGVPPLVVDPDKLEKSVIEYGDPVTIIAETGSPGQVLPRHLDIEDDRYCGIDIWVEDVYRWICGWHRDNGIRQLKFKSNIDSPSQYYKGDGIGLLRTEHFILSSSRQLESYKRAVLDHDESAFLELQAALEEDLTQALYPVRTDFPVRIRLVDLPAGEAFDEEEAVKFAQHYGDCNVRGVQLAERLPELYEAQIRGIFEAFIEFDKKEQEECVSAEYEPVARPEILVPTVRNSDELRFVKALTARIASECGLTEEGYTFGSMLETIDACNNIESIAPECDFLSIGSNDLTEEVLYCSRHDFAARNKLMMAHWKNRDPFLTLYDPVIQTIYDAVGRARSVNPDIQVDLCGAHAEDIASLEALRSLNLDGVSVPPTEQNMNTLPLEYNFSTFRKHQDTVNSPLPDNNRAPEI